METGEEKVLRIKNKTEKLITLHLRSGEEVKFLKNQVKKLEDLCASQATEINELKEKQKILKISGSLGEGEKNSDAKRSISELVREIDRCIALLNR